MTIFYAVVKDDPLDSGGRVLEGGTCGTIAGEDGRSRSITFLGQKAWCDKCKTAGVIVAAPGSPEKGRLHDLPHGRRQALGGDLVICQCECHPRIVSCYGRKWKIRQDGGSAGSVAAASRSAPDPAAIFRYDDRYVLRDADGHILACTAYAIQRETGEFEYGKTDDGGCTHLLSYISNAEAINFYFSI